VKPRHLTQSLAALECRCTERIGQLQGSRKAAFQERGRQARETYLWVLADRFPEIHRYAIQLASYDDLVLRWMYPGLVVDGKSLLHDISSIQIGCICD
jgi:hypothetical protein